MELTRTEWWVIGEMVEDFLDKDRHGELTREWGWGDEDIEALGSLYDKIRAERQF